MRIRRVAENKKAYLALLLIADEQENMLDKYLERGEMFVLEDGGGVIAECVVTRESNGVYELKNIAVLPEYRRKGYARRLIEYIFERFADCETLIAGTGDVPSALSFYRKCGFAESHRVKNFFTDNYAHEMYEDGIRLVDMVYLSRRRDGLPTQ